MNIRYRVELSEAERDELAALLSGGKQAARKLKRAQILLAADAGASDEAIAAQRRRSAIHGLPDQAAFRGRESGAALSEEPRPGAERKLTGQGGGAAGRHGLLEASRRVARAGRWSCWPTRWSGSPAHESLSRETVRRRLAENELKPWRRTCGASPRSTASMSRAWRTCSTSTPRHPIRSGRWSASTRARPSSSARSRQPIPAEPGQLERYDYEYRRNGTANLFVFLDAHRPWRKVKVTDRRTAADFAECMRDLVDVHYPDAERIRVVLDNLSTHTPGALYEAFPPHEARRILRRLEFHYTPKHASWLNMVEIEIGVLRGQCLDRRIDNL